jgi:hypothetical protein
MNRIINKSHELLQLFANLLAVHVDHRDDHHGGHPNHMG